MNEISGLATEIFQNEFQSDTGIVPRSYIEAWLNGNLGYLNAVINTTFSGSDAPLDLEAQAIYKEMYLSHFYNRQSRNALLGIMGGGSESIAGNNGLLSISDGNSSASFINKNEVSKVYKSMAAASDEKVKNLSHQYNMYQSAPLQLGGIEACLVDPMPRHNRTF